MYVCLSGCAARGWRAKWPLSTPAPIIASPPAPPYRAEYFNRTTRELGGHQLCDCYREPDQPTVENRYYERDGLKAYFFWWVGAHRRRCRLPRLLGWRCLQADNWRPHRRSARTRTHPAHPATALTPALLPAASRYTTWPEPVRGHWG